jgi:CDGSH-type Zn-finger protein
MDKANRKRKIRIVKNGPYLVIGKVPLSEKIIVPKGKGYEFKEGRELPQAEEYALCRCGQTKNAPFCDGTDEKIGFIGTEVASKLKYEERAKWQQGADLDLMDDHRCALARFCNREHGTVWELVKRSGDEENRKEAIQGASECPAGRLVAVDKSGRRIEPEYEPSIAIIQDPEKGVSGGIIVRGNIPLESADGSTYELRNRYDLCRCGQSANKPFCDATHVKIKYSDKG